MQNSFQVGFTLADLLPSATSSNGARPAQAIRSLTDVAISQANGRPTVAKGVEIAGPVTEPAFQAVFERLDTGSLSLQGSGAPDNRVGTKTGDQAAVTTPEDRVFDADALFEAIEAGDINIDEFIPPGTPLNIQVKAAVALRAEGGGTVASPTGRTVGLGDAGSPDIVEALGQLAVQFPPRSDARSAVLAAQVQVTELQTAVADAQVRGNSAGPLEASLPEVFQELTRNTVFEDTGLQAGEQAPNTLPTLISPEALDEFRAQLQATGLDGAQSALIEGLVRLVPDDAAREQAQQTVQQILSNLRSGANDGLAALDQVAQTLEAQGALPEGITAEAVVMAGRQALAGQPVSALESGAPSGPQRSLTAPSERLTAPLAQPAGSEVGRASGVRTSAPAPLTQSTPDNALRVGATVVSDPFNGRTPRDASVVSGVQTLSAPGDATPLPRGILNEALEALSARGVPTTPAVIDGVVSLVRGQQALQQQTTRPGGLQAIQDVPIAGSASLAGFRPEVTTVGGNNATLASSSPQARREASGLGLASRIAQPSATSASEGAQLTPQAPTVSRQEAIDGNFALPNNVRGVEGAANVPNERPVLQSVPITQAPAASTGDLSASPVSSIARELEPSQRFEPGSTASDRPVLPGVATPNSPVTSPVGATFLAASSPQTQFGGVEAPSPVLDVEAVDASGDVPVRDGRASVSPNVGSPTQAAQMSPTLPQAQQIARQISVAIQNTANRTFEVSLSPAELGNVRISLTNADAGMIVTIQADRPETLDLMRRNADLLADDFRDLGFEDTSFSFEGSDQQPQSSVRNTEQAEESGDRPSGMSALREASPAPTPSPIASDGAVDIRL